MIVGTTLSHVQPCLIAISQKPASRKLWGHHQTAAVHERGEHRHRKRVDVIQRQNGGYAIGATQLMLAADRLRIFRKVRLRQHHALRLACRA